MTKAMNVLANGSSATLVHYTEAEMPEAQGGQRAYTAICGRTVRGYLYEASKIVTCAKCNRLAA